MDLDRAKLVLVRGLPGSGKSTLAKEIAQACGFLHIENDQFLMRDGRYEWEASRALEAQRLCFEGAREALKAGKQVVVSNAFTRLAHMQSFLALTADSVVLECTGTFGSIHDVPEETMQRMRGHWEEMPGAIRV